MRGSSITIIGLARSGVACANLLYELGARVSVSEIKDSRLTRANLSQLKSGKIQAELGRHSREFIEGRDLVVISPGVPRDALPVKLARELNIPVIGEIELGWLLCPATVIAVTGTSGKTTVTTLIARILEKQGKTAFACGNIGRPFCGEIQKMRPGDFAVLEVSSFQLEATRDFKPKLAVVLNFSRNHLDRHSSMQEYLAAKKRIFANQDKSDYLILNAQDPEVKAMAKEAASQVVYFSGQPGLNPNQAALLAAGALLGIDKQLCLEVLRDFKGLEHRLEYVSEIKGVAFINDSKSTTAESTLWALENIERPVVLIAGGRDKGVDYAVIRGLLEKKAKRVVLIGEAKEKIRQALGFKAVNDAATLEEAVGLAFSSARPGDCVLLSPMCSSFDMFRDYEERGSVFKKTVAQLAAGHGS